ncbi:MAG: alpha/beta hydrolase [Xenococcaceae cyanobacterium MO_167.B27]|nr:alpha/beta hydrolase [Xenococcaceae cyanobacterium MO_167.B27]
MNIHPKYIFLLITSTYHLFASLREKKKQLPPGQLINLGGYRLHLYTQGQGNPTVILDHSLGGIEGYFLIDSLAQLTQVCIYDRPGYGWSDRSYKSRCSKEIVQELDLLLTTANIEPPYILVGDSFGSYNMRLYAHLYPEKVVGIVLTDGLHETAMLTMSPKIIALKLFFLSGFLMSVLGSLLGIIRLLGICGVFELLKPELKKFPQHSRNQVKKSFYSYSHWLTMAQEISNLNLSSEQLKVANNFSNLPIVSIKSKTFLHPSIFNWFFPLTATDKLRDKIHQDLSQLSTNFTQLNAEHSSHFVWLDQPEIIINAVEIILSHSSLK